MRFPSRSAAYPLSSETRKYEPAKPIQVGLRNDTLVSIVGHMRADGHSVEKCRFLLQAINANCCEKPLPLNEIRAICKWIGRKPPRPTTLENGKTAKIPLSKLYGGEYDPERVTADWYNIQFAIPLLRLKKLRTTRRVQLILLRAMSHRMVQVGSLSFRYSQAEILGDCGLSERSTWKALKDLQAQGLIKLVPSPRGTDRRGASWWKLTLPVPVFSEDGNTVVKWKPHPARAGEKIRRNNMPVVVGITKYGKPAYTRSLAADAEAKRSLTKPELSPDIPCLDEPIEWEPGDHLVTKEDVAWIKEGRNHQAPDRPHGRRVKKDPDPECSHTDYPGVMIERLHDPTPVKVGMNYADWLVGFNAQNAGSPTEIKAMASRIGDAGDLQADSDSQKNDGQSTDWNGDDDDDPDGEPTPPPDEDMPEPIHGLADFSQHDVGQPSHGEARGKISQGLGDPACGGIAPANSTPQAGYCCVPLADSQSRAGLATARQSRDKRGISPDTGVFLLNHDLWFRGGLGKTAMLGMAALAAERRMPLRQLREAMASSYKTCKIAIARLQDAGMISVQGKDVVLTPGIDLDEVVQVQFPWMEGKRLDLLRLSWKKILNNAKLALIDAEKRYKRRLTWIDNVERGYGPDGEGAMRAYRIGGPQAQRNYLIRNIFKPFSLRARANRDRCREILSILDGIEASAKRRKMSYDDLEWHDEHGRRESRAQLEARLQAQLDQDGELRRAVNRHRGDRLLRGWRIGDLTDVDRIDFRPATMVL